MNRHIGRATELIGILLLVTFAGATKARPQNAPVPLIPTRNSLTAVTDMHGPAIGEQFTELAAGVFTYSKTDLSLPGPMPINVTRVYRSEDITSGSWNNRAFGIGTRLNYDIFKYTSGSNEYISMPDSSYVTCTPSGSEYLCNSEPSGVWFGSTISGSTLTRPDGTVYSFHPTTGLLLSITDRFNNSITITRGALNGSQENSACQTTGGLVPENYVGAVSSSNGRAVYFCYDDQANNPKDITGIADNAGPIKKVTYSYNSGTLETVIQANYNSHAVTTYQYGQTPPNAKGDVTTIIVNDSCPSSGGCGSPNQVFTYITYMTDGLGTVLAGISSQLPGNGYNYNYNSPGGQFPASHVTITLPDSATRDFYFDSAGYVIGDTRNVNAANPEHTSFDRGPQNCQQEVGTSWEFVCEVDEKDSNQNKVRVTTYTYDTIAGTVTHVKLCPAPGQSATTCGASTPTATWNYTYDSLNRLTNAVEPLDYNGVGIKYVYTGNQIMTVTDQLGRVTTVDYNSQGQPMSVQDPLQNPATQIQYYSPSGDLKSITDPASNITTYVTDADGRVISVTSPLNEKTQYYYDAIDDVTQITDPLGNLTCNKYDLIGELASTTPPKGVGGLNGLCANINSAYTTTITRSPNLARTTVTDPLGNQTVTNLDGMGRKTDFTDKRNFVTTYTYNKFGEVTEAFFNSNNKSGYSQEKVDMSNYDALDRVGQITDSLLNTNTFTYDSLDSILQATDNYISPEPIVSYAYDSNGRRISMTPSWEATFKYGYDCGDELVGISNGTWTPPNCSPSTFVNYTGNISSSAQVAFNLDADSNAAEMLVDGVDTKITARDADERIKAESFQPYASPSPSYGGLTYTYDPDGHVIDKGGTLAAINFPPAATASYSNADQITMWNHTATNPDKASNIIDDPNGLTFKWNARNMISTVGGSVAAQFSYDGTGRRETSNATPPSAIQDFEYDGSSMIGWNTLGSSPSYNFVTIPGGGALAGSFTSGGTTTTWVPLIDASGSTLGLVNAASPQSGMATTYTYDPSGTPSASGAANEWPFQYQGREKQFTDPAPYYYSGSGQFYSPQFVRSLSEAGPTSTSGPAGHGGGASSDAGGAARRALGEGSDLAHAQFTIRSSDSSENGDTVAKASPTDLLPVIVQALALSAATFGLYELFDNLFGGGGNSVEIPRQLLHGRHPLYSDILGLPDGEAPEPMSAGQPQFCRDPGPCGTPLQGGDDAPGRECSMFEWFSCELDCGPGNTLDCNVPQKYTSKTVTRGNRAFRRIIPTDEGPAECVCENPPKLEGHTPFLLPPETVPVFP